MRLKGDRQRRPRLPRVAAVAATGLSALTVLTGCSTGGDPAPVCTPPPDAHAATFDWTSVGNPVARALAEGRPVAASDLVSRSRTQAAPAFTRAAADGNVSQAEWDGGVKTELDGTPRRASGASRAVARHLTSSETTTDGSVREALDGYLNARGYDTSSERPRNAAAGEALYQKMVASNVTEEDAFYKRLAASRPGRKVIVAVLDDGFDMCHPAFEGRLWTNPGEVAGNGKDDDRNGLTDDVHGADFVSRDGSPHNPTESGGHGTHTAGLSGEGTDDIVVMPVRVFEPISGKNVAAAIDFAAKQGAEVVNMSFKVTGSDVAPVLAAMGRHPDVLFVKSAGNDGRALSSYDAASYLPKNQRKNLMVVSAATPYGTAASYSNTGRPWSTHADRGSSVRSAVPGGRYKQMSGTSMSTPNAANAAAKVRLNDPGLTAAQVSELLADTTLPSADWMDLTASGGLIDEDQAGAVAHLTGLVRGGVGPLEASKRLGLTEAQRERVVFIAAKYLPVAEGARVAVRAQLPREAARPSSQSIVSEVLRLKNQIAGFIDQEVKRHIDPIG